MKFKTPYSNLSGQFLVEAIVAISIIVVGLLGILSLLSSALSLNRVVADQYTASYLAAEGIEVVKSIIDRNVIAGNGDGITPWNQGLSGCTSGCEVQYKSENLEANQRRTFCFNVISGVYSYECAGGQATNFTRTIRVNFVSADEIRVNSEV